MKTSRLLAAVCFLASANAMAFQGPKPTSADEGHAALMRGWTPRPTQKPENHFDLRKRAAASGSLVGYDAPDNTCGYVSGSLGAIKSCFSTEVCNVVVYGPSSGGVGCCSAGGCEFLDACIDYNNYYSSSACNDACQQDTNTIKCTNPALPYCYGYIFTEWGASLYQCDSTAPSTFDELSTTFLGESNLRTWTPLSYTASAAGTNAALSSTSSSTPTSSSTTSTDSFTPVPTFSPSPGHSTPVGAIVGGIVGGLAVIGAIIAGLVYMCVRNRRNRRNNPGGAASGPATHINQEPQMGQQPHQDEYHTKQAQQPMPGGGMAYFPHDQDPKQAFQTQTQPTYAENGFEHISPPLSPAPQYSDNGMGASIAVENEQKTHHMDPMAELGNSAGQYSDPWSRAPTAADGELAGAEVYEVAELGDHR